MYWECPTLFIEESAMTKAEGIDPTSDIKGRYPEISDDPVKRWHGIVSTYSELNLTFEKDRLPAVAAIVEREMRRRQNDTYVAGMWTGSLLTDLLWHSHKRARHPHVSSPTWAWPCVQGRIQWYSGSLEPSLRLVDLSFTHIGPAHVGEVKDANITLEGRTYALRLKKLCKSENFAYENCIEIAPSCYKDIEISVEDTWVDYNWNTGDRPVTIEDSLTVLLVSLSSEIPFQSYHGLILRETTDGLFERMGVVGVRCGSWEGKGGREQNRILLDFVEALPIRQVKII
jgi:hypothetical protein